MQPTFLAKCCLFDALSQRWHRKLAHSTRDHGLSLNGYLQALAPLLQANCHFASLEHARVHLDLLTGDAQQSAGACLRGEVPSSH
jgi:hypothetical protein